MDVKKLIDELRKQINDNGYELIKEVINSIPSSKFMFFLSNYMNDNGYELIQDVINSTPPSNFMPFLSNYMNDTCITVSGIADISKRSSQAVISMIKCNDGDFPCAYTVNGTNMYIKEDVINWLINNNKIPRDENDNIIQEFLYGNHKSIYFTGGPGNGKSTICASGANKSIVAYLKKILTAGGAADTENLIKLHFKRNSVNYVIFHYGESCNDSIPIKINEENISRIKDELKKCKDKVKEYRENKNTESLIGTYVEFVLEPNEHISKLMNDCNIDVLTFIDTPGLDNNHSGDSVAIADIIVIVLGDRDDIENITEKIKNNIVPQTGSSQYIYLYNNRFAFDDESPEDVYEEFLKDAKNDLEDYKNGMKNLQDDLVIGSTLSACSLMDSLLCVPNFKRDVGVIEDFFFSKFCEEIKKSLTNSFYIRELNHFDIKSLSDEFLTLLNKHMIMFFNELPKDTSYDIDSFIDEKHGRTKSLDNYRIENTFNLAIQNLKKYFYKSFSDYKTKDCDENQKSIIRMVFLTINEALMNRVHYGYGSHPWEDLNSPTQMICEEVLSNELIVNSNKLSYCQILQKNSIVSNSWNYVYVNNTDWNKAKLLISNHYKLCKFKTNGLESYMKVCHFLPSILVQSVLVYYKMNPSLWDENKFSMYNSNVISVIMKNIQF